jgi:hypothetical protein
LNGKELVTKYQKVMKLLPELHFKAGPVQWVGNRSI